MKFLPNSSLGKDEVLQSFFWGMMKFGSDKVFSKPVKRNLCLSGSVEVEHLVSVSRDDVYTLQSILSSLNNLNHLNYLN